MKKIISILLTIIMVCSVFSSLNITTNAVVSGDYKYKILSDGTAEITDYTGSADKLIIPDVIDGYTVTNIGNNSFEKCTSLTDVTISGSVTSIGSNAFKNCSNLNVVRMSDSVTNVGSYAFSNCKKLYNVFISELAAWCNINFSNSSSNPLYNNGYLYYNKTRVTNLEISGDITSIGNYAFYNCQGLTKVTIGGNVKSIGNLAFCTCDSLTDVVILDSVTNIGEGAFSDCSSLENVSISAGVTSIGKDAFLYYTYDSRGGYIYSSSIKNVYISDIEAWCNIDFGNSYSNPFWYNATIYLNNEVLRDIYIPDSLESIKNYTFYNCKGVYKVHITNLQVWCNSDFESPYSNPLCNGASLYLNNEPVNELVIPDGVEYVGGYTFYHRINLKSVTIPDSVTRIGNGAFGYCTMLRNITIPDSVTSIGDYAFYGSGLREIDLSDRITSIGDYTFYETGLMNISIPDGVESIGDFAFCNCKALAEITIPDSVRSIGDSAFNYSGLKTVTILGDVTSIGERAFAYCNKLTDVIISGSITEIDTEAFYESANIAGVYITDIKDWCNIRFVNYNSNPLYYGANLYLNDKLLTDLVIPDGVTSIGDYVFYNCTSLTSVTIPDSVTSIGNAAFITCSNLKSVYISDIAAWCNISFGTNSNPLLNSVDLYLNNELLTEITIPDGVTRIGDYAFYNCTSLTSVTIPDSVTSIGDYAFYNCKNIENITLPDGVTSIGAYVLAGCSGLTSITLSDSLTSIGDYAFNKCENLHKVYISDIESWCNIYFGQFYSTPLIYGAGLYVNNELLTELVIPDSVTYLHDEAFAYYDSLKSVIIPDSVTGLAFRSFYSCKNLTSVKISNSVTFIGKSSFQGCSSLTEVIIPASVKNIEANAFKSCASLRTICIKNSNCTIYSSNSTIPGICTIYGYVNSTANKYADNYGMEFLDIKSNHIWDEGVINQSDCTTEGTKIYNCTLCDETKTEVIPATEHKYKDGICINCSAPEPVKNGIVEENGGLYYYVDGVKTYAGLIKIDNDYYYVTSSAKVVAGKGYYVSKTNLLLPSASYKFDDNGRMINPPTVEPDEEVTGVKNGLIRESGALVYYVNDVKTYGGLVKIDGNYYYINSSCKAIVGKAYYVSKTNKLMERGSYKFDATGKMVR